MHKVTVSVGKFYLIFISAVFFIGLVIAFFLPQEAIVKRDVIINAKVDKIEKYLVNVERWREWTNLTQMDSTIQFKFLQNSNIVDSKILWKSGEKINNLTLKSYYPNKSLNFELSWENGERVSRGQLIIDNLNKNLPDSSSNKFKVTMIHSTKLTWNPLSKFMGLMMDNYFGPEHQKWLNKLKKLSEAN